MPLHGPNILETIKLCRTSFKNAINIAVFDTSFHKTIPEENYLYAIPTLYYQKYGIRKYGAHGISYSSVLKRYSDIIQKKQEEVNTIICHLGGGCSMCNIKNGKSFDTTMGFTPLAGLIMATRAGSIDPSIITYLIKNCNMKVEKVEKIIGIPQNSMLRIGDCGNENGNDYTLLNCPQGFSVYKTSKSNNSCFPIIIKS